MLDNLDFVKEILLAVKFELIKFRVIVVLTAIVILFAVSALGFFWQDTYVSEATIEIDDSNIIQPLLQGKAAFTEVDHVSQSRSAIYSKEFLELAAMKLGYIDENTSREELPQILRAFSSGLQVESKNRSNLITLAYFSPDPETAYESAKVISEEFVKYQRLSQRKEGEYAYGFISRQADQYKRRLERAELALQEFKANSLDTNEATVQARINELDSEIQELLLSIQDTKSNISEVKLQLKSESEYLQVQSQIFALNKQKAQLSATLTELRTQFQDSYPDIVSVKAQLKELDQQITIITENTNIPNLVSPSRDSEGASPELLFDNLRAQLSTGEVSLKSQQRRLDSLQDLLQKEHQKADILAENQSQAADLMRDYTVNKGLYEDFLARKENAEISVAITKEGQGLSYKLASLPSFPFQPTGLTLMHFFLVAPILAIGVPIALVVALVILDPRLRGPSNLKSSLDGKIEYLGTLPHYHTAFSRRLLNKDVFILLILLGGAAVVYLLSFLLGMGIEI